MKWSLSIFAAVLAVTIAPLSAAGQLDQKSLKGRDVVVRGCVHEGTKKGDYVLTQFSQVPSAGESALPRTLNDGRGVYFWLEDLPKLDKYFNHMVEVTGHVLATRDGKAVPAISNGQQIVKIEGPGPDVHVTTREARETVGTSGTLESSGVFLIRVDVDHVTPVAETCN